MVCAHLPTYRVGQCPALLTHETLEFAPFAKITEHFGIHPLGGTLWVAFRVWVVTIGEFP